MLAAAAEIAIITPGAPTAFAASPARTPATTEFTTENEHHAAGKRLEDV
jgi:hypothetical protein